MKAYFELIAWYQGISILVYFHLLLSLLTLKVSLWWTLFKQFFLDITITHVTKGLRIFCLWLSILGGVNVHFTQEPSDPSYFNNGSDAKLVWDYADPENKIQYVTYSVLVNGNFLRMIVNGSHGVQEHSQIPLSFRGRVKIEGRATLVIKNINPGDNTNFRCELIGSFLYLVQSTVQLDVAGTYNRHNY